MIRHAHLKANIARRMESYASGLEGPLDLR